MVNDKGLNLRRIQCGFTFSARSAALIFLKDGS